MKTMKIAGNQQVNEKNEALILKAIHIRMQKDNTKFVYFEDIVEMISGLTELQFKKYLFNMKEKSQLHFFGNLEECTQIFFWK